MAPFSPLAASLVAVVAAAVRRIPWRSPWLWTGKQVSGHSPKRILAGLAPTAIAHMVLMRISYEAKTPLTLAYQDLHVSVPVPVCMFRSLWCKVVGILKENDSI